METPTLNTVVQVINEVMPHHGESVDNIIQSFGLHEMTTDQLEAVGEVLAIVVTGLAKMELWGVSQEVIPSRAVAFYCSVVKTQLDTKKEVESLVGEN